MLSFLARRRARAVYSSRAGEQQGSRLTENKENAIMFHGLQLEKSDFVEKGVRKAKWITDCLPLMS